MSVELFRKMTGLERHTLADALEQYIQNTEELEGTEDLSQLGQQQLNVARKFADELAAIHAGIS